jgi:hypothetical protein
MGRVAELAVCIGRRCWAASGLGTLGVLVECGRFLRIVRGLSRTVYKGVMGK